MRCSGQTVPVPWKCDVRVGTVLPIAHIAEAQRLRGLLDNSQQKMQSGDSRPGCCDWGLSFLMRMSHPSLSPELLEDRDRFRSGVLSAVSVSPCPELALNK